MVPARSASLDSPGLESDAAAAPACEAAAAPARQALFDDVRAEPWAHDFFALLRRIDALSPRAPRFGRALRTSHEAIRLGQDAELDFAPAALSSFDDRGGGPPRLGVRFFGLLGSQGPMPLHLTEYIRERERFRNDPTAARFLDVFHHRLLSLFYRAWAETQPTVQHDRPADDRYAAWLGASAGLGERDAPGESRKPVDPGASGLPRTAQLHQAGLLGSRSRHPEGLAKLLAQAFGVPVRIETHVFHWLAVAPEDRSRLGVAAARRGVRAADGHAALGRSAIAGHKLRDRQSCFRVVLGPLSFSAYRAFLPTGEAWPPLCAWIRQYAGLDLRWDVALQLAADEVPEPRLGRRVGLGISTWIGRRDRARGRTRGPSTTAVAALPAASAVPSSASGHLGLRPFAPSAGDRCDLRLRPDTSSLLRHRPGAERHA